MRAHFIQRLPMLLIKNSLAGVRGVSYATDSTMTVKAEYRKHGTIRWQATVMGRVRMYKTNQQRLYAQRRARACQELCYDVARKIQGNLRGLHIC